MKFSGAVLWLTAIGFAYFGVRFLLSPTEMARTLGIDLNTGDATSDVRAVYGGLELGVGFFIAYNALDSRRHHEGLVASLCTLLAMGLTRFIGIVAVGFAVTPMLWSFLGIELGGTALCAVALALNAKATGSA